MQSRYYDIVFIASFIIGIVIAILFWDSEYPVGYFFSIVITLYFLLLILKIILRKKLRNLKGIFYYIFGIKKPYSDYSNREFFEHIGLGPVIIFIVFFLASAFYTIWYTIVHIFN